MEEKAGPLKCACANCGEVIRYSVAQVGKTVKCTKCGEESRLPPPPPPNPLTDDDESETPRRRTCSICGSILGPRDFTCPTCEARQQKQKKLLKTIAVTIGVVVAAAVIAILVHNHRRTQPGWVVLPAATNLPPPQIKVRTPKSLNDLKIGRFTLERDDQNGVSRVTGTILNDSDNLHRDVVVKLDILDNDGKRITTLTESIVVLPGGSTWRVITRTPDSRARQVSVGGISEGP